MGKDNSISAKLGPDYYNQKFENVDRHHVPIKNYATTTENAILRMKSIWKTYCKFVKINARSTLRKAVQGRFMNFLHWLCHTYSVNRVSTVETYWRTLSQLYYKVKGERMDPMILRHLFEYINGELADEHELEDSEAEKPLLDVEDFWEVLQCHWVTDTNKFPSERHRVQVATILLFAAYTSSRPTALLGITYGDLDLFVQRDTKTRKVALMLQVKLTKTKSRKKRARPKTYTFTLDDNPFFCLPSHLISLAQDDGALELLPDGSLLTVEQILQLGVRPGLKSQKIPFKPEFKDMPVFRMDSESDPKSLPQSKTINVSSSEPLTFSKFNYWLKRLGIETGFTQVLTSYCLRRGSGNAVNDDSNSNESVRNLIIDHTNSFIFQRNYLSRMIRFDVQAAYRGTAAKTDLIIAAGRMSRLMDPRRPKKLTAEQARGVLDELHIQQLNRTQENLFKMIRSQYQFVYKAAGEPVYDEYMKARQQLHSAKRSREKALLREIQEKYDTSVPIQDIFEQIQGNQQAVVKDVKAMEIKFSFPERFSLAKLFLDTTSEARFEVKSRAAFINNLVSLCFLRDHIISPQKRKSSNSRNSQEQEAVPQHSKTNVNETNGDEPKYFNCLICCCNTAYPSAARTHDFGSKFSLTRHCRSQHPHFAGLICSYLECRGVVLPSAGALMNHAKLIHHIEMDFRTWL